MLTDARLDKGMDIASKANQVTRIDQHTYKVKSQSGNGEYDVISGESGWLCPCYDFMYRMCRKAGDKCKHIYAVEFSSEFRQQVEKSVKQVIVIKPLSDLVCKYCNSKEIERDGVRKNKKSGTVQKYHCRDCDSYFTFNAGFDKMHGTPQLITTAMQLYLGGESLRNVQKFLALQNLKVTHQTVWNWIKRYTSLMQKYLDKIQPQVSGVWRTDELYLKVKGNPKYLYALMDDETRYWISAQVSDKKYTEDIRPLFQEGKRIAGKKPATLISDGAPNFHEAYKMEYWSRVEPRTVHVRHIHMKNDHNNNKMERLNGELRDREKVMRSLKKIDSPIILGMQQNHNLFRGHMGLDGKTPAEAAGIEIKGQNKWITVIQNAASQK